MYIECRRIDSSNNNDNNNNNNNDNDNNDNNKSNNKMELKTINNILSFYVYFWDFTFQVVLFTIKSSLTMVISLVCFELLLADGWFDFFSLMLPICIHISVCIGTFKLPVTHSQLLYTVLAIYLKIFPKVLGFLIHIDRKPLINILNWRGSFSSEKTKSAPYNSFLISVSGEGFDNFLFHALLMCHLHKSYSTDPKT